MLQINQLLIYENILEFIIKQQLKDFLQNNNILMKEQSGFRAKYSSETALQLVLNESTIAISEKKDVGVIFIDYSCVFETIDRHISINYFFLYDIRGKALNYNTCKYLCK